MLRGQLGRNGDTLGVIALGGIVGIVEYHDVSSAHELVEGRERGFRVTTEKELIDAIRAADMERLDVDETFAGYDEWAVLERYLQHYRDLGAGFDRH